MAVAAKQAKPATTHPTLGFTTDADWAMWLERHHASSDGIWMKISKKGSGVRSVTYDEAVHTALCFGWIDGTKGSLDDKAYVQKFTPRRARSIWSRINRERVAKMVATDRMRPAGAREVERAKADGRWDDAYDSPATSTVPPDFQAELDRSKAAAAFFATLSKANRYAILWRIQTAGKRETRTKRIQLCIAMLKREETFH